MGLLLLCTLRGIAHRRWHGEVPRRRLSIHRLDQLHAPLLADRTHSPWFPRSPLRWLGGRSLLLDKRLQGVPEQRAALGEFRLAHPVGQETKVAQPVEAVRRHVQHQPP